VHGAVRLEAHPLNAARTGLKRRDVHLKPVQITFAGARNIGRNANVVISPAMNRRGRRLLMAFSEGTRAIGHCA
jgi:hypothetical protein